MPSACSVVAARQELRHDSACVVLFLEEAGAGGEAGRGGRGGYEATQCREKTICSWWTSLTWLKCELVPALQSPHAWLIRVPFPVLAGTNRPRTPWTVLATSPPSPSMILSGINWRTRWMGCDARGRRGQCNHQWFRSRRFGSRRWLRSSRTQWSAPSSLGTQAPAPAVGVGPSRFG